MDRKKTFLGLLAILAFLIVVSIWAVFILVTGANDLKKHSFKYAIFMRSKLVDEFPVLEADEESVEYFYRTPNGDGYVNGLHYITRLKEDEIGASIDAFLELKGIRLSEFGYPNYEKGKMFLHVEVKTEDGVVSVLVMDYI